MIFGRGIVFLVVMDEIGDGVEVLEGEYIPVHYFFLYCFLIHACRVDNNQWLLIKYGR